ncbi:MAG: hypothetical protein VYA34_03335 [Myxococcota bacterium]|nr:hypothetical protein [Myxococcota bacterium]
MNLKDIFKEVKPYQTKKDWPSLYEYTSNLKSADLAGNDITISFAHYFRSLAAYNLGQLDESWSEIKLSIQAMPINRYSQRLRDRIQNDYVAKDPPKLFGIVYSCQKYLDRAKIVHEKIRSSITSKIIVGNPDQQELFVEDGDITYLKVSDNYESLPLKTTAALEYAFLRYPQSACIKIDDDLDIQNPDQLFNSVQQSIESKKHYFGHLMGEDLHCKSWHFGKCETLKFNRQLYGRPYLGQWCNGPFYTLSREAIEAFNYFNTRYPSYISGELFEDKYVGDVLRNQGIMPTHISFSQHIESNQHV